MNIFINFFIIIAILIGLISSMYVNITIDKSGLKSEPKIFEDENGKFGQFLVKMAKQSENGQWEYASEEKSKTVMADCAETRLDAPREWVELYREELHEFELLEPEYKANKPFLLYMKVEMVDNKLIEPIPFILGTCGVKLTIHLNEEENGKIEGSCSGPGQSEHRMKLAKKWRTKYEKMKMEQISNSLMSSISEKKNENYSNDQENIQEISKEDWENVRMKGKRAKISDDKLGLENRPQSPGLKLMHSSIKAAHSRKGGQQNIRKHGKGKDTEIGHEDQNENYHKQQQKLMPEQQKLMPDSPIYSYLREEQQNKNLWRGENLAPRHIVNEGIGYIDEYGGKQSEFTQINPTGFIHQKDQGNIPLINEKEAEDPMQFWHEILHDLPAKPAESMGGIQHEFAQINHPSGFTHQGQGNIQPTKNAAKSFGDWGKHFHENLPIQPINIVESMVHENLSNQKTKSSASPLSHATGPQNYGRSATANIVAVPSTEKYFTAIDHNEEESDFSNIFHGENPSIEQILSESSNSHSGKSD